MNIDDLYRKKRWIEIKMAIAIISMPVSLAIGLYLGLVVFGK